MWTWIVLALYAVLALINVYIFLFQRTCRKIQAYANLDNEDVALLYPPKYLYWYYITKARYVFIVILLFLNWWLALIAIVAKYLIQSLLRDPDYYAVQTIKQEIEKKQAAALKAYNIELILKLQNIEAIIAEVELKTK